MSKDDAKTSDYPTVDFKGDCGEAKGGTPHMAQSSTGLQPFQSATVNGNPPNICVVGNDGATVFGISLTTTTGFYAYQIGVDGRGPKGVGSGSFYLAFTDQSDDTYYLKLFSSSRERHTVDYNSKLPNIVKIWWSNHDFTVPSANTQKPDFKVTSPAK
ncbi:MAG TPA: hypothetical protein VHN14_03875 [Kofleriaceae bacterium]|jgi:hypothetical protein|nr:hypothetical protein [Kofleriaceae bacterium]